MAAVDLYEQSKDHAELRGAFESFALGAAKFYPNWRDRLGVAAA